MFSSRGSFMLYDGAMGTMLQKNGLAPGQRPDIMNITAPDTVESIHRMYVEAGSEIICANTFGANANALKATGRSPGEIIGAGIAIAKRAAGSSAKVALDIGPVGQMLEPLGDLGYNEAYELFKEQAVAGETAGADFAAIETMSDISELKAAMLAVSENTKLPILATMTFNNTGRTYLGYSSEDFAETAERLGAAAVGINCSLNPSEMISTAERIAGRTSLPVIIKPNAGLPDAETGLYDIGPAEFAAQMAELVRAVEAAGIAGRSPGEPDARRLIIIGGCCGTTPEYISELRKTFINRKG